MVMSRKFRHPRLRPESGGRIGTRALEVVGVLPAAGQSRRLAPLPCSKELLPVGMAKLPGYEGLRLRVVSHVLLERMAQAGVRQAFVVCRQGKWDIPAYWGDGQRVGMDLAYVVIEGSQGPPDTIDRAYPFVKDKVVAFGFPDILFDPPDAFSKMMTTLVRSRADMVLGLFPAHDTRAMDMVETGADGRVREVVLKPKSTRLTDAWVCAVWTPVFTDFLHGFVARVKTGRPGRLIGNRRIDPQGDLPVGAVIAAAVQEGLMVKGVRFPGGRYLDVGTPAALASVSQWLGEG